NYLIKSPQQYLAIFSADNSRYSKYFDMPTGPVMATW
ncbi:MAG: hypothetical protein ACI9WS_002277, partial [Paraglaciecola psychrophila]